MKTKKLGDVSFRCAGNREDIMVISDDVSAAGFIQGGHSVYLEEPELTAAIKRLKKIRKRIRVRRKEMNTKAVDGSHFGEE